MSAICIMASSIFHLKPLRARIHIHRHFHTILQRVGTCELRVAVLALDIINFVKMFESFWVVSKTIRCLLFINSILFGTFIFDGLVGVAYIHHGVPRIHIIPITYSLRHTTSVVPHQLLLPSLHSST